MKKYTPQLFTDWTIESTSKYYAEVRQIPQINAEEEVALAIQIRQGDMCSLEKLISANLRFVIKIAKEYQNKGIPLGDLINEGNLGLIRAAKQFDETKGFRFNSYSVWWIRQSIIQAFEKTNRIIRLPKPEMLDLEILQKIVEGLFKETQREPTMEEMVTISGFNSEKIRRLLSHTQVISSIDSPVSPDNTDLIIETLKTDEETPDEEILKDTSTLFIKKTILETLEELPEADKKIILYSFGVCGMPIYRDDDICRIVGISKRTIFSKRTKILKNLNSNTQLKTAYKEILQ